MGMTLKELLTKGEGTLSAQEAKALAAQCRMDVDTLYTLLEERGIKVLEEENEPSLDVDSIIAEVENAENNNDDMGLADENEEDCGILFNGILSKPIATAGRHAKAPDLCRTHKRNAALSGDGHRVFPAGALRPAENTEQEGYTLVRGRV